MTRDTRSRADKLRAMAHDTGATEGERDNARRLLERMGEPLYKAQPTGTMSGDRPWTSSYDEDDPFVRSWRDFQRQTRSPFEDFFTRNHQNRWGETPEERARREERARWKADLKGRTTEEIRKIIEEMAEEIDLRSRTSYSAGEERLHEMGNHSWTIVGHGVTGVPIERCIICGVWRRPEGSALKHDPQDQNDHHWIDDAHAKDGNDEDLTMWTQHCSGCTLRRVDPKQPVYWSYHPPKEA